MDAAISKCSLVDIWFHWAKISSFWILDLEKTDISVSQIKASGDHGPFSFFVGGPDTE